jgi:hypothetical protein
MNLEEEFEITKARHKYSVLKARIMQYYMDLEQGQINLPNFMREDNPEKLADRDIRNLLLLSDGGKKFNELYEHAWHDVAEYLN